MKILASTFFMTCFFLACILSFFAPLSWPIDLDLRTENRRAQSGDPEAYERELAMRTRAGELHPVTAAMLVLARKPEISHLENGGDVEKNSLLSLRSAPEIQTLREFGWTLSNTVTIELENSSYEGVYLALGPNGWNLKFGYTFDENFAELCPEVLEGLQGLQLPDRPTALWATLSQSPHLNNLFRLDLVVHPWVVNEAEHLIRSNTFSNIKKLYLRFPYDLTDESEITRVLAAFAQGPAFPNLTFLEIRFENGMSSEPIEAFVGGGAFAHLERLSFLWLRNAKMVEAFAKSGRFPALKVLDLSHGNIGSNGAKALAESPHLRNLQSVYLRDARIGEPGVLALAAGTFRASLREIDLSGNSGTKNTKKILKAFPETCKVVLGSKPKVPSESMWWDGRI